MSGKVTKWTPDRKAEVENAVRSTRTRAEAAKLLGVGFGALDHACRTFGISTNPETKRGTVGDLTILHPSSPDMPLPELLAQRKRLFDRKSTHADESALIPVKVRGDRPIGILLFGDPHLDDDGCDLATVERHAELVRDTDGLYGATVGDIQNNWVGRLAHLWAQQGTTACDAWRLCEWFVEAVDKWLFIVGGNHDAWSGNGDPIKWIAAQQNALYQSSEVRIGLQFPNGLRVKVNARHDFAGHSQWNPVHALGKAIQMGLRDHLNVAGHLHISGHGVWKDPTDGITCHGVRVATYKRFDRYALDHNLRDQNLSPCALVVIDPKLPNTHPDLIKLWWDPHEGADYLTWKRTRAKA